MGPETFETPEPASLDRGTWSKAQRAVFEDALDGERLMDIVNGWTAATDDATRLDRKIFHVEPLAHAAASLLMSKMVELYEWNEKNSPLSEEAVPVGMPEALNILLSASSWWPSADDLDETKPQPSRFVQYFVATTPFGEQLPKPSTTS